MVTAGRGSTILWLWNRRFCYYFTLSEVTEERSEVRSQESELLNSLPTGRVRPATLTDWASTPRWAQSPRYANANRLVHLPCTPRKSDKYIDSNFARRFAVIVVLQPMRYVFLVKLARCAGEYSQPNPQSRTVHSLQLLSWCRP